MHQNHGFHFCAFLFFVARALTKKSVNILDYKERVTIGRVHYWVKSDRYFARDGWTEHIRALVSALINAKINEVYDSEK